jgi:hypothetical protein
MYIIRMCKYNKDTKDKMCKFLFYLFLKWKYQLKIAFPPPLPHMALLFLCTKVFPVTDSNLNLIFISLLID